MATKTLSENITQAVSDFGAIKQAITDKGVEVTSGTPTSKYGEKIREIPSGTQPPINGFMPTEFNNDGFPTKGTLYGLTTVPDYYFHVTSSGGHFKNLNNVEFEKEITDIGNEAFYYCKALTAADFPSDISIGSSAFYHCEALTTAKFPSATSIGSSAFYYCKALTAIDFPSTISIGGSAFSYCDALTTANFSNATSIGNYSFSYCHALTKIDFPKVTSIGGSAFSYCSTLTKMDFPLVTSIGSSAFSSCSKLGTLIIRTSSVCTLNSTSAFLSTPIKSGLGYIYVPSALINDYETATNWSTYSSRFRAIEDYPNICG